MGARRQVTAWVERRMRGSGESERAWLRTVLGAVAADLTEAGSAGSGVPPAAEPA
jgi:cell volume regulation protein A